MEHGFTDVESFLYLGFVRNITVEVDIQLLDVGHVQLVLLLLQLILRHRLHNDLKHTQCTVAVTLFETCQLPMICFTLSLMDFVVVDVQRRL